MLPRECFSCISTDSRQRWPRNPIRQASSWNSAPARTPTAASLASDRRTGVERWGGPAPAPVRRGPASTATGAGNDRRRVGRPVASASPTSTLLRTHGRTRQETQWLTFSTITTSESFFPLIFFCREWSRLVLRRVLYRSQNLFFSLNVHFQCSVIWLSWLIDSLGNDLYLITPDTNRFYRVLSSLSERRVRRVCNLESLVVPTSEWNGQLPLRPR